MAACGDSECWSNIGSFDIWRQTTIASTTAAAIVPLSSIIQMQRCNVWPISIRSPKSFQALKSGKRFGGNGGGNLLPFRSFFTLEFDSRRLHHPSFDPAVVVRALDALEMLKRRDSAGKTAFCPETRPTLSRGGVMIETQHPTEPHSPLHRPIGRD